MKNFVQNCYTQAEEHQELLEERALTIHVLEEAVNGEEEQKMNCWLDAEVRGVQKRSRREASGCGEEVLVVMRELNETDQEVFLHFCQLEEGLERT